MGYVIIWWWTYFEYKGFLCRIKQKGKVSFWTGKEKALVFKKKEHAEGAIGLLVKEGWLRRHQKDSLKIRKLPLTPNARLLRDGKIRRTDK